MPSATSPALDDLLDRQLLATMLDEGYVRQQAHPTAPLAILNYSEKAAYEGVWNAVTLACRGLVHDVSTGRVVARPFAKFFNYGQAGAPDLELDAPALVTEKADGSLGILYPLPDGGHAIATRGSFASDQALHATAIWQRRYAGRFTPPPGQTVVVEIVYPANRIVVDYGDLDDLVLLGAVDIATGAVLDPAQVDGWPGPVVGTFPAATLAEALALPPRPNAEGFVVRCRVTGAQVKIKFDAYIQLHRLVTGLTARTVWEHLVAGRSLPDVIAPLPDEFHPWVREIVAGIQGTVDERDREIRDAYTDLVCRLPAGAARKEFAALALPHPDRWALFALLDGHDIGRELLRRAKPDPHLTPSGRTFTEDNA